MPTGYAGEGKTYSKKLGRWLKKDTHKAFDYESVNVDSVVTLINFFRWYPDYFADLLRDPYAKYQLELPQRVMLRILARYRNVYITAVRGATKTYLIVLSAMIEGILFPGQKTRYCAPNQKQAAALATKAFHEIEKSYPIITNMWSIKNDRNDMFQIQIPSTGSEFTMYTTRGDTTGAVIGEECGQEGEYPFPIDDFIVNILPTVRDNRMINQQIDKIHVNLKHQYIGNATTKLHQAYTKLRHDCLTSMLFDADKFEGFALDFSWITAYICNLRDTVYIKDQKRQLAPLNWLREMCALYTGTNENSLVTDEVLARCRKLLAMEDKHCGDNKVIYIVSHDVSYEDGARNAKCADVVVKLTQYQAVTHRDKYKKQVVWADSYPPPATAFLQAQKLKSLWLKFCKNGAEATYLVVDAQAYGREVVEELMKPSKDGTPNLCCYNHMRYKELEQPHALPVIYPLKAGTKGTVDEEGAMLQYAQVEFEQGNVELLTPSVLEGIEQYKRRHNIKDSLGDARIALPYKKTEELCQQIQNLMLKTSGTTLKEERKSNSIQRDIWSSLKYAFRVAKILEEILVKTNYQKKSSWAEKISQYNTNPSTMANIAVGSSNRTQLLKNDVRGHLLEMRRRG